MDGALLILGIGFVVWLLNKRRKAGPLEPERAPNHFVQPSYLRPSEQKVPPARASKRQGSMRHAPPAISQIPIKWKQADQHIVICGFNIPSGLIYVGTPGREEKYQRLHAHLIDPTLSIRANEADVVGSSMSYWPHYADLTPSARLAYLQWQATGRRDARYGIGHIFLFFYGLEHRIFIDKSREDHDDIVREVSELLNVYGNSLSFRSYATTFLAAARLALGHLPTLPSLGDLQISHGLSPDFRIALSQRLNEGPLSAEWLLAWYLAHPEKSLRTPATRCFTEFKALFVARFNAEYPKGLNVRKSSRKLNVEYRSASGAFTINLSDQFPGLTEPDAIAAPLKIATDLASSCTEALSAYSRHIGRNPSSVGNLAAQLLLPAELRMTTTPDIQALKASFATLLERSIAQIPLTNLLSMVGLSSDTDLRIPSAIASRLSEALAQLDIGMEPDNRYGGKLPVTSGLVTIFKSPNGAAIEPLRPEYTAARVLVEVAVLAAGIEGNDVRAGLRAILDEVDRLPSISSVERVRLSAYVLHLSQMRSDKMSGWNRLASLPIKERERIAHVALCALTADGRIEGPEIKFAERLYGALGIPLQHLYNDVHKHTGDEPQTVRPAETHTGGTPIPTRPQRKPGVELQTNAPLSPSKVSTTVSDILGTPTKTSPKPLANGSAPSTPALIVDLEVLKRTRRDTADVRIILDAVYRDESTPDDASAAPAPIPQRYPGLDRGHEALLDLMLKQQGTMQRADFDVEVKKLKLFTDGALDKINDWSFDQFGDSLIEDGDPLTIPPHLLVRLKEMALPT